MERIREALKRAREERNAGVLGLGGGSTTASVSQPGLTTVGELAYSQAQTINVSRDFLLDKRIVIGLQQYANGTYADAFKILSTRVSQRLRDGGWNTLMVTSPGEHEGKTLIAINLALSLALEVNRTVLLVDADLRDPGIHEYFGLHPSCGLSDYLASSVPFEELSIYRDSDSFAVLPAGKPLLNSSEMLGSPKMAQLVRDLKNRHSSRILVFDLPPILTTADVLAFSPCVDATLLVVEERKTRREDVVRAAEMLGASNLIGVVLNKSMQIGIAAEKS
jgi:protein-tyrosine kinase